jgi:4-diphosphocytidyl-2C-methyl-D-erythritol kinase
MSGSGPTVFGVFPDLREARTALERSAFEAPAWARVALAAEAG